MAITETHRYFFWGGSLLKRFFSLFAVLLLVGAVFAQEPVTLSGTVINSTAQPLAGAIVTVHNIPELSATTDAAGNFSITTVAVRTPSARISAASDGALLNGHNLTVAPSVNGAVVIDLFTAGGRRVAGHTVTSPGAAGDKLLLPVIAEGLYVLKVSVNGKVVAFKQFFTAKDAITITQQAVSGTQVAAIASTKAFTTDSLVVVATGFAPHYLKLSAYVAANLQVKMEKVVTPWQPVGPLEHATSMVKIEAKGLSFAMGQPVLASKTGLWYVEQPGQVVKFTYDFWMDTTEVTQKMVATVMADVPGYAMSEGWNSTYGFGDGVAAHHMSISDAMLYCNARSKKEGFDTVYAFTSIAGTPGRMSTLKEVTVDCSKNGYRLPTEAEWEYACRGGAATDFYWNKMYRPYPATVEDTAEISTYALWYKNAGNLTTDNPNYALKQGVASKLPNKYGLYDMVGGAMEWYHVFYDYGVDVTDPKPAGEVFIEGNDPDVQPRGGNYGNHAISLRSAARVPVVSNYFYCYWGFRTVREVRE